VNVLLGPEMDGYQILLHELKERIRTARLQAALAVNQELVLLYSGYPGRELLERLAREDCLPGPLSTFATLAETHPDRAFVQQVGYRWCATSFIVEKNRLKYLEGHIQTNFSPS